MATDFWASSHYKRWLVDRATLKQARADDLQYVDDPDYLDFLAIYFANVISKLGKKLQLRQRAIATATVFFRRFYLKNSYCETDPFIVISACCYVAAKAEESPIHIKNIVAESRSLFSQENYGIKHFPSDHTKLAEMEFYLVDDLECDLTVFHPYRTLLSLCRKEAADTASLFGSEEGEADEAGVGISGDDGPRYWGTGEGQLELSEGALQTVWFIINDTYRSDLCLLHPPHIIAIAALYLTFILHQPTRDTILPQIAAQNHPNHQPETPQESTPQPRRSSRQANHHHTAVEPPKKPQDPITFLAELNVSLPLVATVAQEIISLYTLWDRYKEDAGPDAPRSSKDAANSPFSGSTGGGGAGSGSVRGSVSPAKRSVTGSSRSASNAGTPMDVGEEPVEGWNEEEYVTPVMLSALLLRMRESRLADMSHPASGRPVAVNKMLERTQAAG
ncbi:RNA polymerase II holoenzyme cyclin-like subunit [Hypsizygus marmoreus]|uniref:RNA polymerase II holoenzyme cyclin-like subunit n=1 Tax=Hypsizygus marmoreus TaxID=39966 RepID=A0A369JI75_HYPMA|nr:RNA polymerase II holoenzyme cyclin-like subunit [Hypsizygus marmoreus]